MLYIVYGTDKAGEEGRAIRAAAREAHFAYLEKHEAIIVLGGATLADPPGDARTGSVLVINVSSRAEADAFAKDEPFRKAGLFASYTVTRMRRGQWNPAAAPKTAEGN
jgi:uncharacterized protein YciI